VHVSMDVGTHRRDWDETRLPEDIRESQSFFLPFPFGTATAAHWRVSPAFACFAAFAPEGAPEIGSVDVGASGLLEHFNSDPRGRSNLAVWVLLAAAAAAVKRSWRARCP
jgi:hypothetical protein